MTQQLKPFQKVLVRDNDCDNWKCGFFSHMRENKFFKYAATDGVWRQCIPYEGNEHLTGTSNNPIPPESEFRFGDKVEVSGIGYTWHKAVYLYPTERCHIAVQESGQMVAWEHCRKADW